VQIVGSGYPYYSLVAALAAASGDVTLRARNFNFTEDVTLDRDITIILRGGFQDDFSTVNGMTELEGTLTITNGCLILDNLMIR
jgi:hypothetical protein